MHRKRRALFSYIVILCLLFALVFLITHAEQALNAAREGLDICFTSIIPSLFPFFVLSSLLLDFGFAQMFGQLLSPLMQPLFGLNGSCASAIVLGFIGGYPVGARTAAELYRSGQCSQREAERLLSFCNNAGPAFIFGILGTSVFGGGIYGILLFAVHMLSALCVGLCGGLFSQKKQPISKKMVQNYTFQAKSFTRSFTQAVTGALQSTLQVSAFVILFTIISQLLSDIGFFVWIAEVISMVPFFSQLEADWIRSFFIGLLELSSGAWSLQAFSSNRAAFVLASFMLAWGGLSVHCQSFSVLSETDLSVKPYLIGKLLQSVIAATLAGFFFQFIPYSAEASYLMQAGTNFSKMSTTFFLIAPTLLLLLLTCLMYFTMKVKNKGRKFFK